jgi:tetratricopeptide (TPR) repeat protein
LIGRAKAALKPNKAETGINKIGKLPVMYKKRVFYVVLVLLGIALSGTDSFAQKKEVEADEKSKRYKNYKIRVSTEDVSSLLDDARKIKDTNPREALNNVEEALGLSLTGKDALNEGRCYILLGEINEGIQEWKLALENYNSAYERLKKNYRNTPEFKTALRGSATTNLRLGNSTEAMRLNQEALTLQLNTAEKAQVQLDISEVQFQEGNYTQALGTVQNIQPPKVSNSPIESGIDNQKAKIFARLNEVDKAKDALQSSQNSIRSNRGAIPQQQEDDLTDDLKKATEEVAGALHEQKRYDEEIDLRNQSIELNLESNKLSEVTKDKVGISKALAAKGETSEAIRELEEAALMADTINNPKDQAKAFLALADLYEKNGRNNQALSTYKKYSRAVTKADAQNETRLTEKADLIKKQKDIEELTKDVAIGQREETIAEGTVFRQQLVIYGLLLILVITAVTSYFTFKSAQASKVANQLLALKSLRSQMNPHFIFNALNSVNHFVSQNDERTTNKFLSEFSRLMRLVMENSQEDFIPLYKEQEIISLYLKLEHYRFRDKFDYEMTIDENINPEVVEIPPMLLQPYIENAVWHGLRYKESKGHLSLHMRKNLEGLEVEITDNGIGRKRSSELKTNNQKKQNSTGLRNIEERLTIINKVYKAHYRVRIEDLEGGTGTRVLIHVPEHKQNGRP